MGANSCVLPSNQAGEPQTQRPGVERVGLAFAVERYGRDQETLRAGGHQFPVQHEAEPATLLTPLGWAMHGEQEQSFFLPLSVLRNWRIS